MLLVFPSFNLFSMPLLILVLQGYGFAFLLLQRFWKNKHWADLFLGLLLIFTGYQCTTYIIGFMDWYDTYRTTKVNYWLWDLTLGLGPLLYFYIKSLTQPSYQFGRKELLHFLPLGIYILHDIGMWFYDMNQPGFEDVQNGVWKMGIGNIIGMVAGRLGEISLLVYCILAVQTYKHYRQQLRQYFSNTYQLELRWIRNFLIIYILLFIFNFIIFFIDDYISSLHWQQKWWGYFAAAIVVYYVGMKGYFADLSKLFKLTLQLETTGNQSPKHHLHQEQHQQILDYMSTQRPYLDPELTIADLSKQLHINSKLLSQIINTDFQKNFKATLRTRNLFENRHSQNYIIIGVFCIIDNCP